jgi:hypothetical protein
MVMGPGLAADVADIEEARKDGRAGIEPAIVIERGPESILAVILDDDGLGHHISQSPEAKIGVDAVGGSQFPPGTRRAERVSRKGDWMSGPTDRRPQGSFGLRMFSRVWACQEFGHWVQAIGGSLAESCGRVRRKHGVARIR